MKKMCISTLLIIISLLATGCVFNTGASVSVYDNKKLLVAEQDTYNLVQSSSYVEENCLKGSAESMEGTGIIWRLQAEENTEVTLTYQLTVSSGKAKLVLIAPDDTITELVECVADTDSAQESSVTFQAVKGKNRIKLVGGKDTKIEYVISTDKGDLSSFGD